MDCCPKVSICIPTFNRYKYLEQTIESALNQDYLNIEVVISDNASTDETGKIISKFITNPRFTYNRNSENIGMVGNWRKMFYEISSGDWFVILSDDDYFIDSSYISKAMNLIKQDSDINMVYASGYIFHTNENKTLELNIPYKAIENGLNIFNKQYNVKPQEFTLCNILFNSNLAKKLNAFHNLNNLCCDSELFLQMCLSGKVGVIKDFVSVYRYHGNNLITAKMTYPELLALIDCVLEPYKLALKNSDITNHELKQWKSKVLNATIKHILLQVHLDYPKEFKGTVKILSSKTDKTLYYSFMDPIFIIKLVISKNRFCYNMLKSIKSFINKIIEVNERTS